MKIQWTSHRLHNFIIQNPNDTTLTGLLILPHLQNNALLIPKHHPIGRRNESNRTLIILSQIFISIPNFLTTKLIIIQYLIQNPTNLLLISSMRLLIKSFCQLLQLLFRHFDRTSSVTNNHLIIKIEEWTRSKTSQLTYLKALFMQLVKNSEILLESLKIHTGKNKRRVLQLHLHQ